MTVTATAKPAATKRTRTAKPANPVVTPEQAAELVLSAKLEQLKAAFVVAREGEAKHKTILKDAKLAWENTRVITSRLAYSVAMLKPNADGEHNLSYAARELLFSDADKALTGDKLKARQKSANSTLRNYVAAGAALQAAGLNPMGENDEGNTAEPTQDERDTVAEAFRNGNKRNAGAPAATKDEGGSTEGVGGATPADDDALTFADLTGLVGRAGATLKTLTANGVKVDADEAKLIMAALGSMAMLLSEYAELDATDDA